MADALHAVDKQLWVMIPMGDEFNTLDLETLAAHADHFIAMLYDETSDVDPPGPIASQDWFEGWLQVLAGYGEPDLWIGGDRRVWLRLDCSGQKARGDDFLLRRDEPGQLRGAGKGRLAGAEL